jgi:hypothetical protein
VVNPPFTLLILYFPLAFLFVRNQFDHALGVRVAHDRRFSQISLSFLRLFGQDMTLKRVVAFDLAGSSHIKPFGRAAMGLHFRHGNPYLLSVCSAGLGTVKQ